MSFDVFSSQFAQDIYLQKYSMDQLELWADTCKRVVDNVCGQLLDNETKDMILKLMIERKFIPGGRYLYSAGRAFHQVNNCFLFKAEDSREGWSDVMHKITMSLMTGGGIGVDYSDIREEGAIIKRTGGTCTGPIALMEMVNEAGRHIMQGGARRSAIWAGLNWKHKDIFKFIKLKDWSEDLKALKVKDPIFRLPMEGTNISVIYDTEFYVAISDRKHPLYKHSREVWKKNCRQAFETAEPGASFNFLKDAESLRNAPISADTHILTDQGYLQVRDIVDTEVNLWTGKQWTTATFKKTKSSTETIKINMTGGRSITCDPEHEFLVERYSGKGSQRKLLNIDRVGASELEPNDILHVSMNLSKKFNIEKESRDILGYTLGYVYGDGSFSKKYPRAEVTCCTKESKHCVSEFSKDLITSINWEDSRGYTRVYFGNNELFNNRSKSVFPQDVYDKSAAFQVSFLAGLFDSDGSYDKRYGRVRLSSKHKGFLEDTRRLLETLGILSGISTSGISTYGKSIGYTLTISTEFTTLFSKTIPTKRFIVEPYDSYRKSTIKVISVEDDKIQDVFCCDVGVEEHSFMAEGIIISNCTEVVSEDDSDKCNLGTMWINRFENKEEFAEGCKLATTFLMCGGLYSDTPTELIKEVGDKNNRIGLGLGGIHEWLMVRGYKYEVTPELHKWLNLYEQESDAAAYIMAKQLGVAIPKGKRAIAPTGTIGIIAETTTGIEPLFCKAYKRRYLVDGKTWKYQYVVDGTVKRLLDKGVKLEDIQDTYDISFKERVKFQADIQNYVDMSISSTCNLPPWGSDGNNEETLEKNSKILLKYGKRLRGFTCYPDGSRGGQPLTRVELNDALDKEGQVFEDKEHECLNGICGI